ncbi:MAG: M1 family metallopeptidase [Flavobacteriaceae bacterium]|nr:M1 family metallopeptidase [Flavobacteriaceae bacterium]
MKLTKIHNLILVLFLGYLNSFSQQVNIPLTNIDVLHYHFFIAVNDSTNVIKATAKIEIEFLKESDLISLNFIRKNKDNKGMLVSDVQQDGVSVTFKQTKNYLNISVSNSKVKQKSIFKITYAGIPKDGLIISKNMYGDRTFFGDNWPNRAQNWLPCVDYLSDKAYVDFYITAPAHYQVIANGSLKEQTNLNKKYTLYHWQSSVPLPTDVMVIGIAKFAVQHLGKIKNIPVSSWVYPQNKEAGFYDYAQAEKILLYFQKTIAPYPFKKLANVQSKTRFGGMENASNIFYYEKSVTGKRKHEDLLAHEIAHQWFGDSVTETDWPHLWLNEGFATYLTNTYLESTYGKEVLETRLKSQRKKIIAFSKKWQKPVVDFNTENLMRLLNPNSYEKGAWFLHMLRRKLGDVIFYKTLKIYYNTYQLKNADTEDFQTVAEQVSGKNLEVFFNQWLYKSGQPKLNVKWQNKHKKVHLTINQVQSSKTIFTFPLSIKFTFKDNSSLVKTFNIGHKKEAFKFSSDKELVKIKLDPNTDLLFEEGFINK